MAVGAARDSVLLLALALCLQPHISSSDGPARPGDKDYCIDLASIYTLDGSFEKPFDPSGSDFTVNVQDIHLKKHVLHVQVDATAYAEGGFPDVYIDGKKEEDYNPDADILVETQLDKGIDGVEKTIEIRVGDPEQQGGGLFSHAREHKYNILIKQPPEYDLVLQAQMIKVTDSEGAETQAKTPFQKNSTNSDYEYFLKETPTCKDTSCPITLQVKCSDVATGLNINSKQVENGKATVIDMSNYARKAVSVICLYENQHWSKQRQMRYYSVILNRDVKFQGDVLVQIPGFQGVCEKHIDGEERSFDCRTLEDTPRLIFHSSQHQARMTLIDEAANTEQRIQNGIPMNVGVPEDEHKLQFKLTFGSDEHLYPIHLHKPALCDGLECPEGQALKEPSQSAVEHMCYTDACNVKDDAPACCGDRAKCSSYTGECKAHTALRHDADQVMCKRTVCKDDDQDVCCQPLARCDTYPGCPAHEAIRWDAKKIECVGDVCSVEKDHDTCCRPKAKCSTYDFPCPEGKALAANASVAECGNDKCKKEDADACCDFKVKCSTFEGSMCPEGKVVRHDAAEVECNGCKCNDQDAAVCCKSTVSCDSFEFECPAGLSLIFDPQNVGCAGDVCTEEADTEACCQARCGYFDGAQCPDDKVLTLEVDYICNNGQGDRCTADECCVFHGRCDSFDYECPEGKTLRSDAEEVECNGPECVEKDAGRCCRDRATCASIAKTDCPDGTVPGGGAVAEALCEHDFCDWQDADTCCVPRATCDTFTLKCPEFSALKQDLSSLECEGETCGKHDISTCCGPLATCNTLLDCNDKLLREDAWSINCSSTECTEKDIPRCCKDHDTCLDFIHACPEGTALAYRAAERLCRGFVCDEGDSDMCCLNRESCANFNGKCPHGQHVWEEGVCEDETCSDDDVEVCCVPEALDLEGLMRLANIDFQRLQEKGLEWDLEQQACSVLTEHVGATADVCDATVFAGLHDHSADIMFQMAIDGVPAKNVSAWVEGLKNAVEIARLMNSAVEGLGDFKASLAPVTVAFLAMAEGQVDATHGGVYFPAILNGSKDGLWTINFAWGDSMTGINSSILASANASIKTFSAGDRVRVLIPLQQAAYWQEIGITTDIEALVNDKEQQYTLRAHQAIPTVVHAPVRHGSLILAASIASACVVGLATAAGFRRQRLAFSRLEHSERLVAERSEPYC